MRKESGDLTLSFRIGTLDGMGDVCHLQGSTGEGARDGGGVSRVTHACSFLCPPRNTGNWGKEAPTFPPSHISLAQRAILESPVPLEISRQHLDTSLHKTGNASPPGDTHPALLRMSS